MINAKIIDKKTPFIPISNMNKKIKTKGTFTRSKIK
jgi:hypothetical protein